MQQFAASLQSLMTNFVAVYRQLADVATEKTALLVQGDVGKLEALLTKETELLFAAGKLEKQRVALLAEWRREAGWTEENVTTQFVLAQLADAAKDDIAAQTRELKRLIAKIQAANVTNGELIKRALHFVNYSLELLSGHDAGEMTYGANGSLDRQQGRKILDQKI